MHLRRTASRNGSGDLRRNVAGDGGGLRCSHVNALLFVFILVPVIFLSIEGRRNSLNYSSKLLQKNNWREQLARKRLGTIQFNEIIDFVKAYKHDYSPSSWNAVIPETEQNNSTYWEVNKFADVEKNEPIFVASLVSESNNKDDNVSGSTIDDFVEDSGLNITEKLARRRLREIRRERRVTELIQQDPDVIVKLENAAFERSKSVDTAFLGKYNIWRREFESENPDSDVRLLREQMIMARIYLDIAMSKGRLDLYQELQARLTESHYALGDANSNAGLHPSAPEKIKAMGRVLSKVKGHLYDCKTVGQKLRVMLQSADERVRILKKQGSFLSQLAAKTIPSSIHCLSMRLTIDYNLLPPEERKFPRSDNLEDPKLYHYALFSDNVLAASVVVNSTVMNAKEPEKHVFHLVTDKLNHAAMSMWFLVNPPGNATIHVENVDDFRWLNSSYSPVLRQLESASMREFYFKASNPTSISSGSSNLKYRNPKYLSMLNHLRFYLPRVYPKLDKILFLDDDIVVQKDLTGLWSVDLKGKVNGAVETCGESFHRFDKYLNFSNPKIAENFDPNACGWAYGMNVFDLKEWKKQDITGIYHKWQDMNEDRGLWKLGTLPPGLITFYGLTFPLDKYWHVLGLGYNPGIDSSEIENAAVVHYNGNMKPWLGIAITKYKPYWTKYIKYDNPYLVNCSV